jgi:hypothetical protein
MMRGAVSELELLSFTDLLTFFSRAEDFRLH